MAYFRFDTMSNLVAPALDDATPGAGEGPSSATSASGGPCPTAPAIAVYPLDGFLADEAIYPRLCHDPVTIERYAEAMSEGTEFPPIVAVQLEDGTRLLADGLHRLEAARLAKLGHIKAAVRPGTPIDALVAALRCNVGHGLPLQLSEKRGLIEKILSARWDHADAVIAREVGVAPRTIARYRDAMRGRGTAPATTGQDIRLVIVNGQLRRMNVTAIGRRAGAAQPLTSARPADSDPLVGGSAGHPAGGGEAPPASPGRPLVRDAASGRADVAEARDACVGELLHWAEDGRRKLDAAIPQLSTLDVAAARRLEQGLEAVADMIQTARLAVYGPAFSPRGGRRIPAEICPADAPAR